jgi:signal transduction histidine kinase
MTFHYRLRLTMLFAVLVPMGSLALFIREEMSDRLTTQYEDRVASLITVIEDDLEREGRKISNSLAALRRAIIDDNRFRRAAVDRATEERRYLLDYAGNALQVTGLSMLQIQDDVGRIISSGHFRNEYDRLEPELPELLGTARDRPALVSARAPDAPFIALAGIDSFQMGGRRFTIVAGVKVDRHFLARLARGDELTVSLIYPGGLLSSSVDETTTATDPSPDSDDDMIVRELRIPFVDTARGELIPARIRVSHDLTDLRALRRSMNLWYIIAVFVTGIFAVLLASALASRISRPLKELSDKTSRVDLDRLDIDFKSPRNDEIGALSRLLGSMTDRLRASAIRIRDAERRATLGELARQVNHDIKNGLIPIRNVFRHMVQLARDNPEKLPEVFDERRQTIDSSISYLEDLASNYARLTPRRERQRCDLNSILQDVMGEKRVREDLILETNRGEGAVVTGDPVSIRRIIENLVDNAIDSIGSRPGTVTASTDRVLGEEAMPLIRITIEDTGSGMSKEERDRAFDDFFTTKDDGTGLGLSIVRRLVMDLDGSIRVESEVGRGSRFIIELPGIVGRPESKSAGNTGSGREES